MHRRLGAFSIVFLFVAVLVASTAGQADDKRRDGNWWRSQDYVNQLRYVVGFFDGMELGNRFSYWEFSDDQKKMNECMFSIGNSYSNYKKTYFSNVTNDQIVDGLNQLYTDYKNRRILVHNAIWLVVNGISGKSKDQMETMIENFRKNADM